MKYPKRECSDCKTCYNKLYEVKESCITENIEMKIAKLVCYKCYRRIKHVFPIGSLSRNVGLKQEFNDVRKHIITQLSI